MDTHSEQFELYSKALRSLDKHGRQAEHTKEATHPAEIDVMNASHKVVTRSSATIPYKTGQYEMIFNNSLEKKAYLLHDGTSEEIQVM